MVIIEGTLDFELNKDTAVAIGKFDGMHRGHSKLLKEVLAKKAEGLSACVFTFDPSPAVFFGFSDGRELNTKEEKRKMLEDMGVDFLIEFPMNANTANMEPEVFVEEILVKRLHTKWIIAGTDVSFGKNGAGNAALLRDKAEECGYCLTTIDKVKDGEQEISSTLVRKHVEMGDMEYAEKLLGAPYTITGKVVHGKSMGRKMGMPTVNIIPPEKKLLPPNGVYCSAVRVKGKEYSSISNIGIKPTVAKNLALGVETHLFDFDEEIYDEEIEVCLFKYLRPEKCFSSLEELQNQVKKDILAGKNYQMSKNS